MPQENCHDLIPLDEAPTSSERLNPMEKYRQRMEALLCMVGQKRLEPETATRFFNQKPMRVIQSYTWNSAPSQGFGSSEDIIHLNGIEKVGPGYRVVLPADSSNQRTIQLAEAEAKFQMARDGRITAKQKKFDGNFADF